MRAETSAAVVLVLFFAAMPTAADDLRVIIDASGLRPAVVHTTIEQRVMFVNRTGRPVHLEFRPAPERHYVFQIPGRIWAIFHVAGRHPFVAHVDHGTRVQALPGVVEVRDDPTFKVGPHTCSGTSVGLGEKELCIER